jgi:hypothetical protein
MNLTDQEIDVIISFIDGRPFVLGTDEDETGFHVGIMIDGEEGRWLISNLIYPTREAAYAGCEVLTKAIESKLGRTISRFSRLP